VKSSLGNLGKSHNLCKVNEWKLYTGNLLIVNIENPVNEIKGDYLDHQQSKCKALLSGVGLEVEAASLRAL
jgi:hypothetical protein